MKSKGKIVTVTRNITNSKLMVTLEVDASVEEINSLSGIDLNVELKKWTVKRSLNANSLYWLLAGKLAEATGSTNSEIHNILLRNYGTLETIEGKLVEVLIPDDPQTYKKVLNDEFVHLKPTGNIQACEDGVMRRTYLMVKPSHQYNKEEFSRLIDGCVQECKDIGIETMAPEEIERIKNLWNGKA